MNHYKKYLKYKKVFGFEKSIRVGVIMVNYIFLLVHWVLV